MTPWNLKYAIGESSPGSVSPGRVGWGRGKCRLSPSYMTKGFGLRPDRLPYERTIL